MASWLKGLGFDARLEHCVDGVHYADVYAADREVSVIVEVETGYVPPMFIGSAEEYMLARAIVKTVKYACLADYFYIATPSYVRPPIPDVIVGHVDEAGVETASALVGRFFGERWAEETLSRLRDCRLSGLMLVNVSRRKVSVVSGDDLAPYVEDVRGPKAEGVEASGEEKG